MKKLVKLVTVLALSMTMIFTATLSVFASGENTGIFSEDSCGENLMIFNVNMDSFTPSTMSDSWKSWQVTDWKITNLDNDQVVAMGDGKTTGKIEVRTQGAYSARFKLIINYTYTTAYSTYTSYDYFYSYASTKPATMSKNNVFVNLYPSLGKANLSALKSAYATGVQFQKVSVKTGKSETFTVKSMYSPDFSAAKNLPYKFRARNYYVNEATGKTYYGNYSSYKYFLNIDGKYSNSRKNGINVKLKGVKNVKYKIYVATSSTGTFKYTKTVTPTAGKYKTYLINKIGKSTMKNRKTYYFRLVPYVNNVQCDSIFTFSSYNSRY